MSETAPIYNAYLFLDIVNSSYITTAYFQASGATDASYLTDIIAPFRQLVARLLERYCGRRHSAEGDAYFLTFPDARAAIDFAIDLQLSLRRDPIRPTIGRSHTKGVRTLEVRIGINHGIGNAYLSDAPISGYDTNVAARIANSAHASQILISDSVETSYRKNARFPTYPWGPCDYKGINKSIEIYEILWGDHEPRRPNLTIAPQAFELCTGDILNLEPPSKKPPMKIRILSSLTSHSRSRAKTYLAVDHDNPGPEMYVVKIPRIFRGKEYSGQSDALLMQARVRARKQLNGVAAKLDSEERGCVRAIGTGVCTLHSKDEAHPVADIPFIVHNHHSGRPLSEYLWISGSDPSDDKHLPSSDSIERRRTFSGIKNPDVFERLTLSLISTLAKLHSKGVVHGDIHPDNVLVDHRDKTSPQPIFIDFGEAILRELALGVSYSDSDDSPSSDHDAYTAPEKLQPEHRWYTGVDIYSLGALLFYLATGEHPPSRAGHQTQMTKLSKALTTNVSLDGNVSDMLIDLLPSSGSLASSNRRAIIVGLDRAFEASVTRKLWAKGHGPGNRDELVDHFPMLPSVIAHCMRLSQRDRPRAFELELLLKECLKGKLNESQHKASKSGDNVPPEWPLFDAVHKVSLRELEDAVKAKDTGGYEIASSSGDLIDSLTLLLGQLREGSEYLAVTIPSFWQSYNVGLDTRFLSMNLTAVKNGVRVRRLFLALPEDRDDPHFREIVLAHREMKFRFPNSMTEDYSAKEAKYYCGVVELKLSDRTKAILDDNHFGLFRSIDNKASKAKGKPSEPSFHNILMSIIYDELNQELFALKFLSAKHDDKRSDALEFIKDRIDYFNAQLSISTELDRWYCTSPS